METRPQRKRALITGAGIRVGRAIAQALGRAGFDLLLHANRSTAALEEVAAEVEAAGGRAWRFAADLSSEEEVTRLGDEVAAAVESLDLLVHNAAIYEAVPFEAIDRATYRRMQGINLEAPFFLSQALLPLLRRGRDPSIVHLGDIGGVKAERGFSHYAVAKAGLLMLTRALAVELAPAIRVNTVSPGTVAFPEGLDGGQRGEILGRIPIGKEGSPEDIAKAVVFLATDAPYMTGQDLVIDGGRSALL